MGEGIHRRLQSLRVYRTYPLRLKCSTHPFPMFRCSITFCFVILIAVSIRLKDTACDSKRWKSLYVMGKKYGRLKKEQRLNVRQRG